MLSLLLLIPAVVASPYIWRIRDSPITVPIAARINTAGSANFVQADRLRAQTFVKAAREKAERVKAGSLSSDAVLGVPIQNAGVTYTADVGVGNPPTSYTLLVDSGSSNTWVGANKPYVPTSTSVDTKDTVNVSYGSGSFSGKEFRDRITIPGAVIDEQSLGVASKADGFDGVDGILGIGPVDLTAGTLSSSPKDTIPTVADNLFEQGSISSNEIAVSFEPTTSDSPTTSGELTFGGTNSAKFTGSIKYVPITNSNHSKDFWGIDQTVTYGTSTTILPSTAGIVDTGTTLVLLATEAFENYQNATGGVPDKATGLLKLSKDQFSKLQSLFFTVDGTQYELTPNAQAWPRSLNNKIGGSSDSVYLIVSDLGTPSDGKFDFVNGFAWMQRFYTVYDAANHRIGFATTSFTDATTN